MEDNIIISCVFEDLVEYISKNGIQKSIKPVFKTDDFALYNIFTSVSNANYKLAV